MTVPDPAKHPGEERVRYVFAVGRDPEALEEAAASAHRDGEPPLRTVRAHGLTALLRDVPAERFDEEGMKAQLEDLQRLEDMARFHHSVVAAASELTTVLPMRLATVYLDDARVSGMLGDRAGEFRRMLAELEGRAEWGVKVYADPHTVAVDTPAAKQPSADDDPGPSTAPRPAGSSGAGAGRAYLQQRRANRRRHQEAYRAAGNVVTRVAELGESLAVARVAHRPQQGELASGPGENLANEAYLVPAEQGDEFRRTMETAADGTPGVRVEVTGPWAPYSFATPPQHAPAAAEDTPIDTTTGSDNGR